jgi:hypothetical protein
VTTIKGISQDILLQTSIKPLYRTSINQHSQYQEKRTLRHRTILERRLDPGLSTRTNVFSWHSFVSKSFKTSVYAFSHPSHFALFPLLIALLYTQIMNFGLPVDNAYLKTLPEYKDRTDLTAKDRSDVALQLRDTYSHESKEWLEKQKAAYGVGVVYAILTFSH